MGSVLITGANRGIGLELATRYAERGERVFACCRRPDAAERLRKLETEHAGVQVCELDVADGASVAALAQGLAGESLDVLINNAGIQGPPPQHQSATDMDFEGWAEAFAVNTMAPLRMLQAFREHLKAGSNPRAITVTSQMGALEWNVPVMYAYCSSKAAVNKVMRSIAKDLARDGIAVGLVHPGWVRTDMGGDKADLSPEESAEGIVRVIDAWTLEDAGRFRKWDGEEHPW